MILLRHAEVEEKYHQKYNGHIDIGLSAQGYKEASQLAQYFNKHSFDAVFCSDLVRAKETLKPFKQYEQAVFCKELREKSWGVHEGLGFEEIVSKYNLNYENFEQWINALDGEDYECYIQRVEDFFIHSLFKKEYANVLVLTHAGIIRILMKILLNLSLEEAFSEKIPYSGYIEYNTKLKTFSKVKCNFR